MYTNCYGSQQYDPSHCKQDHTSNYGRNDYFAVCGENSPLFKCDRLPEKVAVHENLEYKFYTQRVAHSIIVLQC